MRIAIIGAGISGLNLANQLAQQAEVVVFEKARGVGGRMSSRRAEEFSFDHGTQCFTARTPEFQAFLAPFMQQGVVSEWKGEVVNLELNQPITSRPWLEPHLVANPNMNALCKALALGLTVKLQTEITPLGKKTNLTWSLHSTQGEHVGDFDWVISTAPPEQTLRLFGDYVPQDTPLQRAGMQSCYALMLGFDRPWEDHWIAARAKKSIIKWISVNSTKPGRNPQLTSLVVHSRNNWADLMPEHAEAQLMAEFEKLTGISCADARHVSTHFWRYAIVKSTEKAGGYLDLNLKLAAVSDWASTSRIEEAWLKSNGLMKDYLQI